MIPQAWGDPKVACSLLSHLEGLQTGTYKTTGVPGDFSCCSQKKELGSAFPLPNNLAYYVEGDEQEAHILRLVLNVNDRASADEAHRELLSHSEELARKALGVTLDSEMREAILSATPDAYSLEGVNVELARDPWPTRRGYTLKFSVIRMFL